MFLLKNGYMAVANTYFREMENISYHVAVGHIDEDLLRRILAAILSDRNRIMQKHEMEETNARWNEFLNSKRI